MEDFDEPKESRIPPVNYQETIAKGRMVYIPKWDFVDILFKLLVLSWIFAFPYLTIQMVINGEAYAPIYLVLSCIISLWLILGLFLSRKIVKVKGTGLIQNKEDAIKTVNEFYPDRTFNDNSDNILRDYEAGGFSGGGRVITVLFNEQDVYFHKIVLGKGDSLWTLWGPADYSVSRSMADYFKYLQEKRALSQTEKKSAN